MSQFFTQGPVPVDADTYTEREFETEVFSFLTARKWVLLLGPRQHGKTSALLRAKEKILNSGLLCAFIDLQKIPPLDNYEGLVSWFAQQVCSELNTKQASANQPSSDVLSALKAAIPAGDESVIIIIDEASGIANDTWRNSFYGQIRSIVSERASTTVNNTAARLVFIFSGTFRPEELVDERNSPFNVCETIETEDLTIEQSQELAAKVLGNDSKHFSDKAYSNVGGQPYLLQTIFFTISQASEEEKEKYYNKIMERLNNGDNIHVSSIFSKITNNESLRSMTESLANHSEITYQPGNIDFKFLKVIGIAKQEAGKLKFRNKLYQDYVLNSPQIRLNLSPSQEKAHLFALADDALDFIVDTQLREIVKNAHFGAVNCFTSGNYRLSLAAFGSALEGLLLDWLMQQNPATLASAVTQAEADVKDPAQFSAKEKREGPKKWNLVNMIKAAKYLPKTNNLISPDSLRNWRNTIHPAVAIKNYMPEANYRSEVLVASGLFDMARRDISS